MIRGKHFGLALRDGAARFLRVRNCFRDCREMRFNLRHAIAASAVAGIAFAFPAQAQDPSGIPGPIPVNPNLFAPPPPPIPPPKIEIQKIPKEGELPTSPKVQQPRRGSFSDRVTRCIEEGAAAGLGPNERAAYSRTCANQ
jgi:hypothetical protein